MLGGEQLAGATASAAVAVGVYLYLLGGASERENVIATAVPLSATRHFEAAKYETCSITPVTLFEDPSLPDGAHGVKFTSGFECSCPDVKVTAITASHDTVESAQQVGTVLDRCVMPNKSAFFLFFTAAILAAQPTRAEDNVLPTFDTVMSKVIENEQVLKNIEIQHFALTIQLLSPGSSTWETSKFSTSGTAWYNGLRHSKARINFSQQVREWANGNKTSWAELQLDVGYDGQFGRIVRWRGGTLGTPKRDNAGLLLPDPPPDLADRFQAFADGTAFSLNYYQSIASGDQPLSEGLRSAAHGGRNPQVAWEDLYGDRTVRLLWGKLDGSHGAVWLDPPHGYAMRKEETVGISRRGQRVTTRTEVPELQLAGPGIWFPVRATREEPYPAKPGTQMRASYHAEKVIANNPDFDESIFTVPFPPGYWITDKVNGGAFYTTDAKATAARIDAAMTTLKQQVALKSGSPVPTGGTVAAPPAGGFPKLYYLVAGAFLLLVALVLWRWKGPKGSQLPKMILLVGGWSGLICAVSSQKSQAQQAPPGDDAVRLNCGLNVAYFGLTWFDHPCDIREVARELHAGTFFERDCSMAAIKNAWEKRRARQERQAGRQEQAPQGQPQQCLPAESASGADDGQMTLPCEDPASSYHRSTQSNRQRLHFSQRQ